MLLTLLFLTTIGVSVALILARRDLAEQKQKLRRYSNLSSMEEFQQQLNSTSQLVQHEISDLQGQKQNLKSQVESLQQQLRRLDAQLYLESLESYESYYNFISSDEYLIQLKCNKKDQETMKERGEAYLCESQLIMNNSKGQGRKMTKNLLDLIKLAFENQCSFVLQEAKHSNASTLEKKIRSTFERINQLSAITSCQISERYLDLKIQELRLRCGFEEKKQKEKADRQEIQRQQRENERERRESEKARRKMDEAEENARRHQEELDQIRREIQQSEGVKRNQLQLRIQELEQQVEQDQRDVEAAAASYRRAKAGHIYVVSNVCSFSQRDIYRIFMTRSANEDEYVRGLNPLVPFPFDIHYKIYSEEASDAIAYLHQRFQEQRVNLDNNRRDFFRAPFDEIERAVEEMRQEKEGIRIEEFNRQPHNLEYLRSLSLERQRSRQ